MRHHLLELMVLSLFLSHCSGKKEATISSQNNENTLVNALVNTPMANSTPIPHLQSNSALSEKKTSFNSVSMAAAHDLPSGTGTLAFLQQCPAVTNLQFKPFSGTYEKVQNTEEGLLQLYDTSNAVIMAIIDGISYIDANAPNVSEETEKLVEGYGFTKVEVVADKSSGFNAIVASNSTDILIGFRGSQELDNFVTDAKLPKTDAVWGRVHSGFSDLLTSNWDRLAKALLSHGYDLSKPFGMQTPKKHIWVSGHSLGGALAVLFAAKYYIMEAFYNRVKVVSNPVSDCSEQDLESCKLICEENVGKFESGLAKVYSFALPPVGDSAFMRCFDASFKDKHLTFVHETDPVPTADMLSIIPTKYEHSKNLIHFTNASNYKMGEDALEYENSTAYKMKIKDRSDHYINSYIADVLMLSSKSCGYVYIP